MKKSVLLFAAGVAILLGCSSVRAQQYVVDDGTAENAYAFGTATSNAGSIWLNEFTVTGGRNQISSVSVAYGSPGGNNQNVNGLPVTALLYNDPNGDGSPLDSTLLGSATGTIQSVGTNTFVTYTFASPVTLNSTNFFVGYYVPGFTAASGTEQFFAAINTSAGNVPSRSFLFGHGDGTEPSLTNLGSNDVGGSLSSLGIAGNWLVRANAVVPEPSTWAMMLGGLGLLVVAQRARRVSRA